MESVSTKDIIDGKAGRSPEVAAKLRSALAENRRGRSFES